MSPPEPQSERTVSTYCYQCVAGPDLLTVRVQDGIANRLHDGGFRNLAEAVGSAARR